MTGSDFLASFLADRGVATVFEVVGGMITHLLDSLYRQGRVRIVSMHHEQAAAFAAEGFARITGIPGVALATSGPGASNLLTGIGSCFFDSVPSVFVTGNVNRNERRGHRAVRQLGFQEMDIVAMARPITKAAWRVDEPSELPGILEAAFSLATTGRRGPVLIDIPMDIQRSEVAESMPLRAAQAPLDLGQGAQGISRLRHVLAMSRRPLIIAGGGIRSGGAAREFRAFVESVRIPVIQSLMGLDTLEAAHPYRLGFYGSYGNRWANLAIARADSLIVLGSRLDIRQTGADVTSFQAGRQIFHVDIDPAEMNNRVLGCTAVAEDLAVFLASMAGALEDCRHPEWDDWVLDCGELRRTWPDVDELHDIQGVNPNVFMHQLSARSIKAHSVVVDVGQHQMWAAQSFDLSLGQRFLTSGGMGSMGFALPAAVGAATAHPGEAAVVIAGDGGFQLNIQELQTIARNRLPLKIVVLNNGCHGMVRQFQESYFGGRYQSTRWGYSAPSFSRVAQAYGISADTASSPEEVTSGLDALWRDPAEPFLLEVSIPENANAYPKIAFGRPMSEMEPYAKPLDMEGT